MDFNCTDQIEGMEISGLSSGGIATVTLTPQELQAMSETGKTIVQYENGDGSQQVMELFIQQDEVSDLQTISSLAEQQGIVIEQAESAGGDQMKIKQEFSKEINLKEVEDDATSLLAKLEANNPSKYNFIQLTSDGKIIKNGESESPTVELAEQCDDLNDMAGDLYQEIVLSDGTTAYIKQISGSEDIHAVQLACMPSDILEQGAFTTTVNLNLQDTQEIEDSTAMMESAMQPAFISEPLQDAPDFREPKSSSSQHAFSQFEGHESAQVVSRAGRKTIRVQLAEEAARFGSEEKIYKCYQGTCGGKIFTSQHGLKVHQRQHSGDKPYTCDDPSCQKAFATSYGLKSHKRIHTGEKPYKCLYDGCLKAFKNSGDLHKHSRTHTGERPFACPFEGCNKRFTTSNIRKVHIRVHTGERPYQCPVAECGKTFSGATNYKNHIRIHTGERPYVCTIPGCGKRFTEYSSLYKHHIVHTHTKPYMCPHCGKAYRQASTLALHRRQMHNDDEMIAASDIATLGTATSAAASTSDKSQSQTVAETEGDEGNLVINTGDSPTFSPKKISISVAKKEPEETSKPLVKASASSGGKSNISIVLPPNLSSVNQPSVFVITDPSQTEGVLQQIKEQFDLSQVEPIIYS